MCVCSPNSHYWIRKKNFLRNNFYSLNFYGELHTRVQKSQKVLEMPKILKFPHDMQTSFTLVFFLSTPLGVPRLPLQPGQSVPGEGRPQCRLGHLDERHLPQALPGCGLDQHANSAGLAGPLPISNWCGRQGSQVLRGEVLDFVGGWRGFVVSVLGWGGSVFFCICVDVFS